MKSADSICKQLFRIGGKHTNEDEENPHTHASSTNINEFMHQALMKNGKAIAYYVNLAGNSPDVSETAKKALEHINEAVSHNKSKILDKPYVFLLYNQDQSETNDSLLQSSWVLLPKSYIPLKSGKCFKRETFELIFFYLNGTGDVSMSLKNYLKKCLTSGSDFFHENESSSSEKEHHPFCREEEIKTQHLEIKQLHESDAGWWLCYYSLMTVYSGNVSFNKHMEGKCASSMPLRKVMPLASTDLIQENPFISSSENSDGREYYPSKDKHRLGMLYEESLTMFVIKRATELDLEFKLAIENENDGKFDDLSIELLKERRGKYFIQAKYKDNESGKIDYEILASSSTYHLSKYFDSYCEIKENKFKEMDGTEDVSIKNDLQKCWNDSRFIICTTRDLNKKDMESHSIKVTEVDEVNWFFTLSDTTFKKCYRIALEDEGIYVKLFPELKQVPEKRAEDKDEAREFLKKLLFIYTEKSQSIENEIKEDIQNKEGPQAGNIIYNCFYCKVCEWMNQKKRYYLNNIQENPYRESCTGGKWFGFSDPVHPLVGREEELHDLKNYLEKSEVAAVITGLSGVGKSELARHYAYQNHKFYENNVVWISAEKGSVIDSFKLLAKHLKIKIDNENGDEKSIEQLVREVYQWFLHKTCLFIFDNAGEFREIEKYLPKGEPNRKKKHYVLVTTKNHELFDKQTYWQTKKLKLGVLSEENAVEFVKIVLEIRDEVQDKVITELVKILGYLPLALKHVVAYIRELKFERKIIEVLPKYEEWRDTAKSMFENSGLDSNSEIIYVTYRVSLVEIEDNPIANKMLCLMSYFAPDNIPKDLFKDLPPMSREKFELHRNRMSNRAIELLRRYSLIEVKADDSMIGIHTKLQEVIRFSLAYLSDESGYLSEAIELMNSRERSEGYQSHLTSIWGYSSFHSKLVDKYYFRENSISTYLPNKSTPLHLLAENGRDKEVDSLLNHISNSHQIKLPMVIEAQDRYNRTPLYMAAGSANLEIVRLLVEKGSSSNTKSIMHFAFWSTELAMDWTPLHIATLNGSHGIVEYLVNKCRADINVKDSLGRTPAILAAYSGHVAIVKFLTKSFAHVEQKKYQLHAEIHYSAVSGKTKQLRDFLNGIDKCNKKEIFNCKLGEWTPWSLVASEGYLDIAKVFVESGAPGETGRFTPLHYAALGGQLEIAELLIDNGANPNDTNEGEWTSLHEAAKYGHQEVVRYFIEGLSAEKHIDINVQDCEKDTPLHVAALHGHLQVVKYLVDKGADVNVMNKWGATPLLYSSFNNTKDVMFHLLLRNDVVIDTTYIEKSSLLSLVHFTPLHVAAGCGDLETVKYLVQIKNMDVDVGKWEWCTPLHVSAVFGNTEVIRYLLRHNADINAVAEIKKLTNILEALKIAFVGLPWHEKFLKIFCYLYNATPTFIFSWTSSLRSTPKACSKSLGHNEDLLKEGSEEQGFLANLVLSNQSTKTQLKEYRSSMEKSRESEMFIHSSIFHTIFNL